MRDPASQSKSFHFQFSAKILPNKNSAIHYSESHRMCSAARRNILQRPFSYSWLKGFSGMVPGNTMERPGDTRPVAL